MKGMIPHHSIAILTGELADIADIDSNGVATTDEEAQQRPVPDFDDQP